jgi:hypothetical protein
VLALALSPGAPPGVPIRASMLGVAVATVWPPIGRAPVVDEASS